MLEVKNIHKSFSKVPVLRGIDFKVEKGEVVAIIGPSGSGKTTLLRCISFLEKADDGQIIFDDYTHDMVHISKRDIKKVRMNMGFVFQSFNLFSNMTVYDNVMEGLVTARKMDRCEARKKTFEVLEKVGMLDKTKNYPGELSGGQQQRVAIARAIAQAPPILLADEPTGNLDRKNGEEIIDLLKLSNRNLDQTILLITHDEKIALEADRIITIEDGKIISDQKRG